MSRRIHIIISGAAFALCAGVGAAALAQPDPAPSAQPSDRIERRVFVHRGGEGRDTAEHLRNILQLRPNQEAALQAYVTATKGERPRMERLGLDRDGKLTTPERLAQLEQRLAEQQARGRATIDATRTFYSQLDASQKRAFDELPVMMLPGGHMEVLPLSVAHIREDAMRSLDRLDHLRRLPEPPVPPTPPAPPKL